MGYPKFTSGSAMAEGPRDALVSRNSATYKTSHLKTRVMGLSCGVVCVILRLAVLIQYRSVTDRQTHRHTTTAYTALSIFVCATVDLEKISPPHAASWDQ